MGLAEQRKKQRIGSDPQNTTWSRDTGRFGFKMLEKMGWTPGKGLGANEDGSQVHVKATVKVDQRGLGADAKTEDNWIENTSGFSQLLAKLNAVQATESSITEEKSNEESEKEKSKSKKDKKEKKEKKDKKEKKSKKDKEAKKSSKDKEIKKDKKDKKRKGSDEETISSIETVDRPINPRLSHRAKYVKNKKMSTSDPSNLKAIFGLRS